MEPPVRLCCGQRHNTVQCPDGLVMCCVCFERVPVDQLYAEPHTGQRWDMCLTCHYEEEQALGRRTL